MVAATGVDLVDVTNPIVTGADLTAVVVDTGSVATPATADVDALVVIVVAAVVGKEVVSADVPSAVAGTVDGDADSC